MTEEALQPLVSIVQAVLETSFSKQYAGRLKYGEGGGVRGITPAVAEDIVARYHALASDADHVEQLCLSLGKELKSEKEKNASLEQRIADSPNIASSSSSSAPSSSSSVHSYSALNVASVMKEKELRKIADRKQARIDTLQQQLKSLKDAHELELANTDSEIQELQDSVASLTEANQQLLAQADADRAALSTATTSTASTSDEVLKWKALYTNEASYNEANSDTIAAQKKHIKALEAQLVEDQAAAQSAYRALMATHSESLAAGKSDLQNRTESHAMELRCVTDAMHATVLEKEALILELETKLESAIDKQSERDMAIPEAAQAEITKWQQLYQYEAEQSETSARSLAQQNSRIKELEGQLKKHVDRQSELLKEKDIQIAALTNNIETLSAGQSTSEQGLREEVVKWKSLYENEAEQNDSQGELLMEKKKQIIALEKRLKNSAAAQSTSEQELREEVVKWKSLYDNESEQNDNHSALLMEKDKQIAALTNNIETLSADQSTSEQGLREEVVKWKSLYDNESEQNDNHSALLMEKDKQIAAMTNNIETLSADQSTSEQGLREEVVKWKSLYENESEQNDNHSALLMEKKKRIMALEKDVKSAANALDAATTAAKSAAEQHTNDIQSLTAASSADAKRLDVAEKDCAKWKCLYENEADQNDAHEKNIMSQKKRIIELEKMVLEATDMAAVSQQEIEALSSVNEAQRLTIETAESQNAGNTESVRVLEEEKAVLLGEGEEGGASVAEWRELLAAAERKAQEWERRCMSLQGQGQGAGGQGESDGFGDRNMSRDVNQNQPVATSDDQLRSKKTGSDTELARLTEEHERELAALNGTIRILQLKAEGAGLNERPKPQRVRDLEQEIEVLSAECKHMDSHYSSQVKSLTAENRSLLRERDAYKKDKEFLLSEQDNQLATHTATIAAMKKSHSEVLRQQQASDKEKYEQQQASDKEEHEKHVLELLLFMRESAQKEAFKSQQRVNNLEIMMKAAQKVHAQEILQLKASHDRALKNNHLPSPPPADSGKGTAKDISEQGGGENSLQPSVSSTATSPAVSRSLVREGSLGSISRRVSGVPEAVPCSSPPTAPRPLSSATSSAFSKSSSSSAFSFSTPLPPPMNEHGQGDDDQRQSVANVTKQHDEAHEKVIHDLKIEHEANLLLAHERHTAAMQALETSSAEQLEASKAIGRQQAERICTLEAEVEGLCTQLEESETKRSCALVAHKEDLAAAHEASEASLLQMRSQIVVLEESCSSLRSSHDADVEAFEQLQEQLQRQSQNEGEMRRAQQAEWHLTELELKAREGQYKAVLGVLKPLVDIPMALALAPITEDTGTAGVELVELRQHVAAIMALAAADTTAVLGANHDDRSKEECEDTEDKEDKEDRGAVIIGSEEQRVDVECKNDEHDGDEDDQLNGSNQSEPGCSTRATVVEGSGTSEPNLLKNTEAGYSSDDSLVETAPATMTTSTPSPKKKKAKKKKGKKKK